MNRLTKLLLAWVACWYVANAGATPGILITNLPPHGSYDYLGGRVYNLSGTVSALRVAVFIYVPGYGWVSKPTCGQMLTPILPDGSWTTDITTGGSDHLATRVAALLVSSNYAQPCIAGSNNLPTAVYSQAIASAVVTRPSTSGRWISFSGYDWWVKSSLGKVGPGANYFSASTNNVWVDDQGQLHLRISNRSNLWQCAEIVSARTFGYGTYRFEVASRVDNLNPNAVLGLFTWSDDPAFAYREIDVECSRWGNSADANNSQFVVQPFDVVGHLKRFAVPFNTALSTHLFTWETNRVSFQSQRGTFSPTASGTNVLSSWVYTLATPQTGDENVRLNLWLMNGWAPTDAAPVEIIVRSFIFVPLAPPQAAVLQNLRVDHAGQTRFTFSTAPDRRYAIQSSSDMLAWTTLATALATNLSMEFVEPGNEAASSRFYRALSLP